MFKRLLSLDTVLDDTKSFYNKNEERIQVGQIPVEEETNFFFKIHPRKFIQTSNESEHKKADRSKLKAVQTWIKPV